MSNPEVVFPAQPSSRYSKLFPFHLVEVDDSIKSWKKDWRGIIGEFFGTLLYVFASALIAVVSKLSGSPSTSLGSILLNGVGNGFAYLALIYNFWNISGGHLNPAVTWGAIITRRIGLFKGFGYIVAQLAGGILGALLASAVTPDGLGFNIGSTWNLHVASGEGFLLDAILSFIFIHTFFAAAFDPLSMGRVAPISIGFALTVAYLLSWPFIGGTTNAARAFGIAVATNDWQHHWVYWIAPLVGSTLASLIYLLIFMTRNVEGALGYHHHPDGVKLVTDGAPGHLPIPNERTRLVPTGNAHV